MTGGVSAAGAEIHHAPAFRGLGGADGQTKRLGEQNGPESSFEMASLPAEHGRGGTPGQGRVGARAALCGNGGAQGAAVPSDPCEGALTVRGGGVRPDRGVLQGLLHSLTAGGLPFFLSPEDKGANASLLQKEARLL